MCFVLEHPDKYWYCCGTCIKALVLLWYSYESTSYRSTACMVRVRYDGNTSGTVNIQSVFKTGDPLR